MVIPVNHTSYGDVFSEDDYAVILNLRRRKRAPRLRLKVYISPLNKDQMRIARIEQSERQGLPFISLTEFAAFIFSSDPQLMDRERGAICVEYMQYSEINHNPLLVEFYTGLPDSSAFCDINGMMQITIFRDYIKWESSEKQGFLSHTLMTLMKLKLNMTDEELAERFKVETYVVNMTLRLWIPALHKALYGTCENLYRYQRFFSMETFTKVIDIVEVCVERPECKSDSRDSRHEIRRAVMAIRADGYFCFGSNVFSQYVPEDECIRRSKFWRSTTDVDIVLTHPEFLQVLISKGVACLSTNSTATERFELATERIAAFKILGAIPLEYASYTSFIFKVCGALSNFKHSIPDDEDDEE